MAASGHGSHLSLKGSELQSLLILLNDGKKGGKRPTPDFWVTNEGVKEEE